MGVFGVGNGLILPSLIGAALAGTRPSQAGAASGVLTTSQQFAGAAGVAVLGAVFFAALGHRSGRADYVNAAEIALWVDLVLVAAMTGLTALLSRTGAPASPATDRDRTPAPPTSAPTHQPAA